ncbi:MAG: hypothetical protein MUO62_05280 [Anaerolineales bacterium]|nr:hypothetical protein [Anaerolineales bacterium]
MRYVIGVDQGGSGTRAAIATLHGRLLGTGLGPGACHVFSGMEVAMNATQTAVQDALDQIGLSGGRAEAYAGGHTGADWADEYDLLRTAVRGLNLTERVRIVNDSIIALRGGTEQSYGAILVAGTGANCAVQAPDGREFISTITTTMTSRAAAPSAGRLSRPFSGQRPDAHPRRPCARGFWNISTSRMWIPSCGTSSRSVYPQIACRKSLPWCSPRLPGETRPPAKS